MRGKRGTVVRLTIERADNKAIETVELKRDRVHEPAVPSGYMLKPGVGYVDLTGGFSNATVSELETAVKALHAQGMTSLVLDIRGNGGGILDQAVKVAEKFLTRRKHDCFPAGTLPGRHSDLEGGEIALRKYAFGFAGR